MVNERESQKVESFKIHHLNCATLCPKGGILISGSSADGFSARLVCHCLLIETECGLVLVDSGLGVKDIEYPEKNINPFFRAIVSPVFKIEETAYEQIKKLGLNPQDVKHAILTHLDLDHVGGVLDFPDITVHVMKKEFDAASAPRSLTERMRYRVDMHKWAVKWKTYEVDSDWFGLNAVSCLEGLPTGIKLIDLKGHTKGHAGVAILKDRENNTERWLLHAGDSYFYYKEMDVIEPKCTIGLDLHQKRAQENSADRLYSVELLRWLARHQGERVQIFCAHDPIEFERNNG